MLEKGFVQNISGSEPIKNLPINVFGSNFWRYLKELLSLSQRKLLSPWQRKLLLASVHYFVVHFPFCESFKIGRNFSLIHFLFTKYTGIYEIICHQSIILNFFKRLTHTFTRYQSSPVSLVQTLIKIGFLVNFSKTLRFLKFSIFIVRWVFSTRKVRRTHFFHVLWRHSAWKYT